MKKLLSFFSFFDLFMYLKFSENVVKLDRSHWETGSPVDSFVVSDLHVKLWGKYRLHYSRLCVLIVRLNVFNFHWISAGLWLKGAVHSISVLRGTWPWLSSIFKLASIFFSCLGERSLDVTLQKCFVDYETSPDFSPAWSGDRDWTFILGWTDPLRNSVN